MRKGWIAIAAAAVLTLIVSVGWVGAADTDTSIPLIADGRVNAWDIAAPVVVYCAFDSYSLEDGTEVSDIQAVNLVALRYEDGSWENVVSVSADSLTEAIANADGESALLDSNYGYSLFLNADGSLTATAPADAEGKVYDFTWNLGDQGC